MTGIVRARYTLEFKQEAVRLVRGRQSLASVAKGLGVSTQSIDNWVKSDAFGGLKGAKGKPANADQMEIARLKAELATTNANHGMPVSPDLLERNFSTPEPNRVLLSAM